MARGIMVSVPFDDLPDSAEVTGRAVRKNPPAFKDEEQPDTVVLAFRRKRIADGEAKLEKIARDLAAAEENARAILEKANVEGGRMIKEAGDSAAIVAERKKQDAVNEANAIMAKAREAARLEQEQLLAQLKREFGRMVVDATSRVTGKVLNNDDQDRINRETAAQVSM